MTKYTYHLTLGTQKRRNIQLKFQMMTKLLKTILRYHAQEVNLHWGSSFTKKVRIITISSSLKSSSILKSLVIKFNLESLNLATQGNMTIADAKIKKNMSKYLFLSSSKKIILNAFIEIRVLIIRIIMDVIKSKTGIRLVL